MYPDNSFRIVDGKHRTLNPEEITSFGHLASPDGMRPEVIEHNRRLAEKAALAKAAAAS